MNPWKHEVDPLVIRRVGKMTEECGELIAVCGRIQIQGLNAIDPSSGKTNIQRLLEEMADVQAQIDVTIAKLLSLRLPEFEARVEQKSEQMSQWEIALRAEGL